jgi:hypothetical protein
MSHIILAGLAETGLTAAEDIKLHSNTRLRITLKTDMFLDCDISSPVKNALSNKLPSFTGSGIIRGCEQSQLLFTNKPLATYFLP